MIPTSDYLRRRAATANAVGSARAEGVTLAPLTALLLDAYCHGAITVPQAVEVLRRRYTRLPAQPQPTNA